MPVPRSTLALRLALGTLAVLAMAGCATSAPAVITPTTSDEPSPTATEELLEESPGAGTAAGELVAGFPVALVPVPEGAQILLSSAQPQADGSLQISLNVRTVQETADLLQAVRAPLLAAGFAEVPPAQPDPSLAGQASFTRTDGAEYVLVGVLDRDGTRTLTLGGTVRP